jgi:hypothetical protein
MMDDTVMYDYHNRTMRDEYSDYYKIAFVRNPWERAVSAFNGMRYKVTTYGAKQDLSASLPVELLVYLKQNNFKAYLKNYAFDPTKDRLMSKTQSWWVYSGDEVLVDFVGRYELYESDVKRAFAHVGKTVTEIPHYRRYNKYDYRDYYDDESIEMVADYYKDDIKNFGYDYGVQKQVHKDIEV